MNCEEFKNQTIVNIYGKLNSDQKKEVEKHILECSECAKLHKQSKPFIELYEGEKEISFPHWGKSWRIISERGFKKKKFTDEFFPRYKISFALVVSLIIFMFGIFIGKQLFNNNFELTDIKTSTPNFEESALTAYAESMELVLINFSNQKNTHTEKDYRELQHKLISEMLAKTEILKSIYSQENNERLVNLFEDIELILLSISNIRPGEKDMVGQLNQIIQQKAIFDQLQQLNKLNSPI